MDIWQLHSQGALHWEQWEDQFALYQVASGETHFLNAFGAAILQQLIAAPQSLDAICAHLAIEFDCMPDAELCAQVSALLTRFDELGLIQRHDD
ncbi:hypothetical protein CKO12_09340 [Chromatium okenii]|uniref:HPr-rel-A system PqqD family peptide chaperone n=1 Tax=Chromatium okenii TaxID=61644 RepID=UPI0019089994|nr:HPr-rel-A system PqqD family peptide chaperone [Chromatium okenii]MBK1642074.1 hypothetical protein [Chromatium okenii]